MIKDFRGREIKTGSLVVYPVRLGANMWMNEGIVLGVVNFKDNYGGSYTKIKVGKLPINDEMRTAWLTNTERIVVVK